MVRRVLLIAACVVLATAAPAQAHGGAILTVHTDGRGSVWVTATYGDGHPITAGAAVALTATSPAGSRVGPVALQATGDAAGTLRHSGTLAPGTWTVTAEMGAPAIGRCETSVTVAAPDQPATPSQQRCGSPVAAPPPPGDGGSGVRWWLVAVIAVLVAAGAAAVFVMNTRRPARR